MHVTSNCILLLYMYICVGLFGDLPGDEFFHDFIGAAIDSSYTHVSPRLGHFILPHVTNTTMQLQTLVTHLG